MQAKMFMLALSTVAGTALAQNSIVNNIPGTFVDISTRPGAAALTGATTSDDTNYPITTSVTNAVFASTTARICTNGFIQFGGAAGATTFTNATINHGGTNSPVGTATTQALFPYWDDMRFRAAHPDQLYWEQGPAASFGLPANRGNVLIIQWNAVGHYLASATTTDFSVGEATYQVQIYSNIVNGVAAQMLYSDVAWEDATMDNGVSATIGFASGTTGGPGSVSNVLYTYNTADSVHAGDVLSLLVPPTPLPPTVAGGSNPASATGGQNIVLTASVGSGINPASTGLAVVGDISPLGGSASAMFHDDGLNGDAAANDMVFSYAYQVPPGTSAGTYNLPLTVTDLQSRSGTGNIALSVYVPPEATDLGEIGAGAGGSEVVTTFDVDIQAGAITWLKFSIAADVLNSGSNYMDIDTEPSAPDGTPTVGSINDTELGMYSNAGVFLDTDDDDGSDWHSQLTYGDTVNTRPAIGNAAVAGGNGRDGDLTIGTYYLAAGCFNSAFATNFGATSVSTASGTIQVNFRTNIPGGGGGGPCSVADVGMAGGEPGQDNLLDNNDFIAFINFFFDQNPIADMGVAGGEPGSDGFYDNNDFIAFINHFFEDVANCTG